MDKNSDNFERKAEILKALAHPVRLCIVNGLIQNKHNVTCIQNCLDLPQSTISRHLATLRSAGIVKCERNKLEKCYCVQDEDIIALVKLIMKM